MMQEDESKVEVGEAPVPKFLWAIIAVVLAWGVYYWATYRTPGP